MILTWGDDCRAVASLRDSIVEGLVASLEGELALTGSTRGILEDLDRDVTFASVPRLGLMLSQSRAVVAVQERLVRMCSVAVLSSLLMRVLPLLSFVSWVTEIDGRS